MYYLNWDVFESINKKLPGKCGNQLKVMYVISGVFDGKKRSMSSEALMKETFLSKKQYNAALRGLLKRGLLIVSGDVVSPNWDTIMKE